MKIKFKKKFTKKYQKLPLKIQKKIDQTILKFRKNIFDPSIENHSLSGKYKNQRSITVSGDFRLIFREEHDYIIVEFIQMGSHAQLYK